MPTRKKDDAGKQKTTPRSKTASDPHPCERIGKKRSDLRCRTPDGQEWASPLESRVFFSLQSQGYAVRRTTYNRRVMLFVALLSTTR
jgi:hypothetical protein